MKKPLQAAQMAVLQGFLVWPARRDSNPRPSESESAAISSFATGGYQGVRKRAFIIHVPKVKVKAFLFRFLPFSDIDFFKIYAIMITRDGISPVLRDNLRTWEEYPL